MRTSKKGESMSKSNSGWNEHEYVQRMDAGTETLIDRDRIGSIIALVCVCAAAVIARTILNG